MDTIDLQNEVRRWKTMAIIAVTLSVGVIGGLLFGRATAQVGAGITKVQLDTSNCMVVYETFFRNLPNAEGIVGGIMINDTDIGSQGVMAYTVCR